MHRPSVVIVSPALRGANNGNWQTASRWASFLREAFAVRVIASWPDSRAPTDDAMLALHARRSAASIAAWAHAHPQHGLAVVLTGTDLYGDLGSDPVATRSMELAQQLVVLQSCGVDALPAQLRVKAQVIYQSTASLPPLAKTTRHLTALMVGHLRSVKSPETFMEAARLLRHEARIHLRHVGEAGEPGWAERALQTQAEYPSYRWLGGKAHGATLRAIQRAHVLVHPSAMEGGAHVIMEAACSGTPVLASRVPGNVGMLGQGYEGYFEHGDAAALAQLLLRCRAGQSSDDPARGLLERLRAQCADRAPLFSPAAERAALRALVTQLLESS